MKIAEREFVRVAGHSENAHQDKTRALYQGDLGNGGF